MRNLCLPLPALLLITIVPHAQSLQEPAKVTDLLKIKTVGDTHEITAVGTTAGVSIRCFEPTNSLNVT